MDTENTWLGQRARSSAAGVPAGYAGFYPLLDGIEALTARLLLAEKAERSLDLQYYLIKADTTGFALINALLAAADRGVRVRFLLDDVFTKGYDAGMAALDSHPNFEIRIFNPFNRGLFGAAYSAATDFSRINRRMHTKSFTADGQFTIVGGRNVADEYFGAKKDEKFGDLDVAGVGPVASDVSFMFETFWNHATALPLASFAKAPKDPKSELTKLRQRLSESRRAILETPYAEAVQAKAAEFLDENSQIFEFVPYRLVYDTPDKGVKQHEGPTQQITTPLRESLLAASNEIILLSPYFVPRKEGIDLFAEIADKGVKVVVVTNSLAANNHAAVHGGYTPSRLPLIRKGIELYEVRPDADVPGSEILSTSGAKATMHTKAYLVDRRALFVGSFNFDPRSAYLNTESGVLFESPALGEAFGRQFDAGIARQTWRVFLDEKGRMRWSGNENGSELIHSREPMASFTQRFVAGLMRLLPVRGQL